MKALLKTLVVFGVGTMVGMAAATKRGTEATAAASDDAAIRAAYAFAVAPVAEDVDPFETTAEKPSPQKVKTVCPCGRTLDCTCKSGECDCAACKVNGTINKCKCPAGASCPCGCNAGKECECQVPQQENLKEKQPSFYYMPPQLPPTFQPAPPSRRGGC